uniref:Granzyme M n=1 Tax=Cyprinodon variegatus TaxID=28743 RepID=A0A3Q2EKY8_CYPVA
RVVGGTQATHGSHPWLVSMQNRGSHFCGGAILTESWVLTAAHCFPSLSEFLGGVLVLVGEFDLRVEEDEQVFKIKSVSVHEKYSPAFPMNYDVALVELDHHITMGWLYSIGARVTPICLPQPDLKIPPWTNCAVAGWGKTKEGRLSTVLREVHLGLVEQAKCKYTLRTIISSFAKQKQRLSNAGMTVLCAGPEEGGRDACQGDSGGPLVCPTGSGNGNWVALGITSWGKGCGRSWGRNSRRTPSKRGSPGIFTDVRMLLPWIKQKLRQCSVRDGLLSENQGWIRNPSLPNTHYDNNLCLWSIIVPPGYSILLEFEHFDVENDSSCLYDRLTAMLLFSSDINRTGQ